MTSRHCGSVSSPWRADAGAVVARIEGEELLTVLGYGHGDVIRGLEAGLPALRAAWRGTGGPLWQLAFMLWRLAPRLAPPMLRWRQARHARGGRDMAVPPLGRATPERPFPQREAA